MKHLICINILIYTAILLFPYSRIEDIFSLYHPNDHRFESYQIFTHMFIHSEHIFFHVFFNMLALFMFGRKIENILGIKKFLVLYLLSGFFAACLQLLFNSSVLYYFFQTIDFSEIDQIMSFYSLNEEQRMTIFSLMYSPMMGSSGAISGIVGAFAKFYPHHKIFILPIPFPIPIRTAVFIVLFMSFLSSMFNLTPGIAHFAHIGGMIFGYFFIRFFVKKTLYESF